MKHFITIIIITFSLFSHAQKNKKESFYKIKGLVTDITTNDTLKRVIVEFMDKDKKWITSRVSDFDGQFFFKICSNKLPKNILFIKTTQAYYKQELFKYKIKSDTVININITKDKSKTFSKQNYEEYIYRIPEFDCIVDEDYDEFEYFKNKKIYEHYCTGEKKKYKSLIDDNEDFSEWKLVKQNSINYKPVDLKLFKVSKSKSENNLQFTRIPSFFVSNHKGYTKIVKKKFLKAGWNGKGKIRLLWLPSFVFKKSIQKKYSTGLIVWYVFEELNEISWLLSPIDIDELNIQK